MKVLTTSFSVSDRYCRNDYIKLNLDTFSNEHKITKAFDGCIEKLEHDLKQWRSKFSCQGTLSLHPTKTEPISSNHAVGYISRLTLIPISFSNFPVGLNILDLTFVLSLLI